MDILPEFFIFQQVISPDILNNLSEVIREFV